MATQFPRAVLFTRPGCHLCQAARDVMTAELGTDWSERDIDDPGALTGDGRPAAEAYGELVPVLEVDGRRVGYWMIDADLLVGALKSSGKP